MDFDVRSYCLQILFDYFLRGKTHKSGKISKIVVAHCGKTSIVSVMETTNTAHVTFQVNSEATVVGYSDRHAGFIVNVSKSGKVVEFQYGNAALLNGMGSGEKDALVCHPGGFCGHVEGKQRWSITKDEKGATQKYSLRGNGRWVRVGESAQNGSRLVAGHSHHYDYNF
jgi:hypothetical protein